MSDNSIKDLSLEEIEAVSGGFILGRLFGSALQAGVDVSNGLLNAVAPIGQTLNLIPGVALIHYAGDKIIAGIQSAVSQIGTLLGGTYTPTQPSHFKQEWGNC
ncbi:hypothetical protein C4K38_4270 [Pseudomonas chlororaphis subsp. piscium]|uniref:hypothetical protein n=1 Tax=Pseudomonas chlororaphis TaxID=587753 RepID=UPI0006A5BC20|nr:hypothetical protein [Pseudomonas chlororaphis]AZC32222.1 hypothetical protein C4K38_4270 [Pseudomonas chlororaphis subsp. piscium]WDG89948.1 hypothetical protein PUP49_22015 [Pseudomonas chlororaphis]SDS70546.1 hypothetical protein SAMN05216585_3125 [Pseudomonas chlororaphis]